MISIEDLDGIKLVQLENFASNEEACSEIERAIQQGSQGWGVRREQGVILRLSRELKIALTLAAQADDALRKLKGLQLENGRLRKRVNRLEAGDEAAKYEAST